MALKEAVSFLIGAAVGPSLGAAVSTAEAQLGRLGDAVQDIERHQSRLQGLRDAVGDVRASRAAERAARARAEAARAEADGAANAVRDALGQTVGTGRERAEVLAALRAARADRRQAARGGDAAQLFAADRQVQSLQTRARDLKAEFDRARTALRGAERGLLDAERTADLAAVGAKGAAAELAATRERARALRDELRAAGVDTRGLAGAMGALSGRLDDARAKLQRLGEAVEQKRQLVGQLKTQLGEAAIAFAPVAAFGAGLGRAVRGAGDFEMRLVRLGNNARLSAEQLAATRRAILDLAASGRTGKQEDELLEGLTTLSAAGFDAQTALAALPSVARSATASGADISDMASLAFTLVNNLKVKVDELPAAFDRLAAAGKEGAFELDFMAKLMPAIGGQAASLGLKGREAVESLAAALQIARRDASNQDEAANNLRNFLAKATAPETVQRFRKLGIDLKEELTAAMASGKNPLEHLVGLIQEATDGDQFKIGELFGDMQVIGFLKPMLRDLADYKRMREQIASSSGDIDRDFARVMASFNASAGQLGGAFGRLGEAIGSAFLPVLGAAARALTPVVDGLARLAGDWPGVTAAIVGVAGGFVALGFAVKVGAAILTALKLGAVVLQIATLGGAIGGLSGGIVGLGAAATGFAAKAVPAIVGGLKLIGLAAAANPLGALILGMAAVATVVIAHWDTIKRAFRAGVEWLRNLPVVGRLFGGGEAAPPSVGGSAGGPAIGRAAGGGASPGAALAAAAASDTGSGEVAHLVSQAAPRASSVDASVSVSTGPIVVNAAPGMDERAVARQVRAELERMAADAAHARRGRLFDEPSFGFSP